MFSFATAQKSFGQRNDTAIRRVTDQSYISNSAGNIHSGVKGLIDKSNLHDSSISLLGIDSLLYSGKDRAVNELTALWRRKDSLTRLKQINPFVKKTLFSGRRPFISSPTGYVNYTSSYRSNIDTPFREKHFLQHQLISKTSLTFFNTIPLQVYTLFRRSNSAYFSNINDVQVQLDVNQFHKNLLNQWKNKSGVINPFAGEDEFLTRFYNTKMRQVNELKDWVNHPAQLQRLVESNEILLKIKDQEDNFRDSMVSRLANNSVGKEEETKLMVSEKTDSLKAVATKFLQWYESKKKELELRKLQADTIKQNYQAIHEKFTLYNELLKGDKKSSEAVALLASGKMKEAMSQQGMPSLIRHLYGIRNFSLGRTQADYSELSVKDMSIKGINFEYNSWYYFAVTAGKIDYRFRDFQIRNMQIPKQQVYMVRFGVGEKEKNYVIASVFKGKRQRYGNSELLRGGNLPDNVMGITLESKWRFSRNAYILGEIGKSNNPLQINNPPATQSKSFLNFSDKTNLAYSVQAYAYIPNTRTMMLGSYKKLGANYQSFRNYNVNAETKAWNIRVEQYVWKKHIRLVAGVRTNDFASPFANMIYKSNSLFWTVQGSIAVKRLPSLSIGYMPSSLISVVDRKLVESFNQVLQVNSSYVYKLGTSKAYSSVYYTRLFNEHSDSALIHYNAKNFLLNQSFLFKSFNTTITGSHNASPNYKLNVIGCSVSLNNNNSSRTVSFGTKINELDHSLIKIGFNASASFRTKKAGDFQLFFEKGWLPAYGHELINNEMATISYTKSF